MKPPIHVLYVDDNRLDRELVRDALEKEHKGFNVIEASSRREFEARLAEGGFDLVLSDVNILGFEGLEVIAAVKARQPGMPVIIVTGTGSEEMAVAALHAGAADYVIKTPSHIQRLPLTIQGVMEKLRLKAEKARAEEAFQNLVSCAPIGIFIAQRGRFQVLNPAVPKITGYQEDELLAKDVFILVAPECKSLVREQALRRLKGESQTPFEFQIITKDGRRRWLMETVVSTSYGGQRAVLGYCLDITEQKEMAQRFLQAQKMEAIGRLAGGVAHDFNNMLMAIQGYAEIMMLDLRQDDPLYRSAAEIHKAAERAASLTRQLLAFSRKQVLAPRVINLNAVVSDLKGMLRRLIGEDVEIKFSLAPELAAVKIDPGQIEQVIMNLAVNSRDAMPQGGKLLIETANVYLDEGYGHHHDNIPAGPYVKLAVSDTGLGITPEAVPLIFEPYYTTKEAGKGTGLGLSTVYGIIKQSGGHLEVESEPGQGTTFVIYLPQVAEAVELPAAPGPAVPLRGWETILVVEDEDLVRGLMVQTLRLYGYQILEAKNGGEALLLCERRQSPIHLLLTDVVMPQLSGCELAERLRRLHPEIRILFMSGYTADAVWQHEVLGKKIPFLQKPFRHDVLAAKVREVLDAPSPGS